MLESISDVWQAHRHLVSMSSGITVGYFFLMTTLNLSQVNILLPSMPSEERDKNSTTLLLLK